jgi:hypothetical protein
MEAKVNVRWSGNKILLVGGAERANRLVFVKKWSKVVRGVWREGFIGYCGKLESYSTVDREPDKLLEERLRECWAFRLENNSGESILNTLQLICDILRCTENRTGIVKTRADESMSYKWGRVIIETVSDVMKSLHVIVSRVSVTDNCYSENNSAVD